MDCAPDVLEQDVRLVCTSGDSDAAGCAHLYESLGAEGKIVRLPEGVSNAKRISRALPLMVFTSVEKMLLLVLPKHGSLLTSLSLVLWQDALLAEMGHIPRSKHFILTQILLPPIRQSIAFHLSQEYSLNSLSELEQ